MLENENSEVRTFVSATLFTLLSLKLFRLEAKAHGLSDFIQEIKKNCSQDYLVQLGYIEDLMKVGDDENDQEDEEIESNCDGDEITDESLGEELAGDE